MVDLIQTHHPLLHSSHFKEETISGSGPVFEGSALGGLPFGGFCQDFLH